MVQTEQSALRANLFPGRESPITHRKSEGSPSRRARSELSRSPSRRKTVAGGQPNRPKKKPIMSHRSKSMGDNLLPTISSKTEQESDEDCRIEDLGARCATIVDSLRNNMQEDDSDDKRVSFEDASDKLKQQLYCGALTSINLKPKEGVNAKDLPVDPTFEKIKGQDKRQTYAGAFASLGSMRDLKVEAGEEKQDDARKECKDEEAGKSDLYSGALSDLLTGPGRKDLEDLMALEPGPNKIMKREEGPIASSSEEESTTSSSEEESESDEDSTASPKYTNHIKSLCAKAGSKSGLIERYSAAAALLQKTDRSKSLHSSAFPVPPSVTVDHASILSSLAVGRQ